MDFKTALIEAVEWLQRDKRVSSNALKRQFAIDDDYLDDLTKAILYAYPQSVAQDGQGLAWIESSEPPKSLNTCGEKTQARFYALLPVVTTLLTLEKRIQYRMLKFIFGIDDQMVDFLREALIFKKTARDEQGQGLVWTGVDDTVDRLGITPQSHLSAAKAGWNASFPSLELTSPDPSILESINDIKQSPVSAMEKPEAERRSLTVMFCDMIGSTELSGKMDPEELREIMRAYQTTAANVIQHYEGYVAQYLGDGLLVYFGWPQAHEDDARRAVYAGLGIIAAITTTLNQNLEAEKGLRLGVRIGIHTGPVVIGEICSGNRCEELATGETINIAARIQGGAAPNSVVVSGTTAHLIQGAFVLEDLGAQALKGVADPIRLFRVRGEVDGFIVDVRKSSQKAPFLLGRDEEIGLLMRRWEQSKEGNGQVVLITGEAGIGKSALVEGLAAKMSEEDHTHITFRCSQYHHNSALYPVISHVERVFGFTTGDTSVIKLDKIERSLKQTRLRLPEAIPLLASLLSIPLLESIYPDLNISPQRQRQQTEDLLVEWLQAESEHKPALVVWEDLHWADASTLELLALFVGQAPTVKMLHVLTCRPGFAPSFQQRSHLTPIMINRLGKANASALIGHIAGGIEPPVAVVDHIVAKADGVPLYVEELTKAVLESPLLRKTADGYELTGPMGNVSIPATLHDSLMARLDRVPIAREVAQLGAVLGREFAYEMLQALSIVEASKLLSGLEQLVENELLYQRGRPPRAKYVFKHALVHEAAYRSMLRKTRRHYHRAIAELMEKQYPDLALTEPETIAYHYTEADRPEQAIDYWHRAGARAQQRSAHAEAIAHLEKSLEILATLPKTAERNEKNLESLLAIGPSLIAIKGFAAQEVGQIYSDALALCRQIGAKTQRFQASWGLWGFYIVRANHREARNVGTELLKLAQDKPDSIYRVASHLALGAALYCLAEFGPACKHLERAIELHSPHQHRSQTALFAADLNVFSSAWAAHPLWHVGYPDRALKRSREAIELAQGLAHPFSLSLALNYSAIFHQFRREPEAARQRAEAAIAICVEQNFAYYLGWALVVKGWAVAELGNCEEGAAEIQKGLNTLRDTEAKRSLPYYLGLLAEVYGKSNQVEEGLNAVSNAFSYSRSLKEPWWEGELYRLKGALLLQKSRHNASQAEADFNKAIETARRQKSLSLELRAATSLFRLWQDQGHGGHGSHLLNGIYNRFDEGYDTPDLKEAKALIKESS